MGAPQPTLVPLNIRPGIFANGTFLNQQGRWNDSNLVRFVRGYIQPVGGWNRLQAFVGTTEDTTDIALTGRPCGSLAWRASSNQAWLVMGTHSNVYGYRAGNLYDITPVSFVTGREHAEPGAGYGDGGWGSGGYGIGLSAFGEIIDASSWTFDVYGDFTIGVNDPNSRTLYQWLSTSPNTVMTAVSNAPSCSAVVVTPEQFIFALGAGTNYNRVQWNHPGQIGNWTPSTTSQAGASDLITNGKLQCGLRLRNETILYTDADAHSAAYVGGLFVYQFRQIGTGCGIVSKRAAVAVDSIAFWMGHNGFFVYDGTVRTLPCDVWDKVFPVLDPVQKSKVWATQNSEFNEITWFFPNAAEGGTPNPTRYVTYNYVTGEWMIGGMDRSAGVDAGAINKPVWLSANGWVWQQESGTARVSTSGSQLETYIESGPILIEQGGRVMRAHTFVADERLPNDNVQAAGYSQRTAYLFKAAMYPDKLEFGDDEPFFQAADGNPISIRRTGRWVRLRIYQATSDVSWVVGVPSLGMTRMGRR